MQLEKGRKFIKARLRNINTFITNRSEMDSGTGQAAGDRKMAHGRVPFVIHHHGGLVPRSLLNVLPKNPLQRSVGVRLLQRPPAHSISPLIIHSWPFQELIPVYIFCRVTQNRRLTTKIRESPTASQVLPAPNHFIQFLMFFRVWNSTAWFLVTFQTLKFVKDQAVG